MIASKPPIYVNQYEYYTYFIITSNRIPQRTGTRFFNKSVGLRNAHYKV